MKLTEATLRKIVRKLIVESTNQKRHVDVLEFQHIVEDHREWLAGRTGGFSKKAEFINCELPGYSLGKRNLDGVDFVDSDFVNCSFDNSSLRNANFTGSDFEGASFYMCDIHGAKFTTELLDAVNLFVVCDDKQLPWLITNPQFKRVSSEYRERQR